MEKKQVHLRVTEKNLMFYDTYFGKRERGGNYFVNAVPALFKKSLLELKGKFHPSELKLMVDVFTNVTPSFDGQMLEAQCADGINLDQMDEKWEVDNKAQFLSKLKGLSAFDKAVLEIWAAGFWRGKGNKKAEDWIKPLQE